MGEHSKEYKDFESMLLAAQAMAKFQSIHNIIRKDYLELLRITSDHEAFLNYVFVESAGGIPFVIWKDFGV